ncbi:type I-E CRISPR-associated endoribonuclease Cas2 [Mycolicibacterium austroafricanum]|uniref:type I-E CRISPR-associated endoribonuclease Cas2 n=1 Tax=Mycolicibacterium austroafricanum TaxID=39687 RepID=UPI00056AEDC0|nr:type I-E CRISPR-associated endoribonuclease Cas2 [Mycolicibacterium austroafricanum]
MHSLRRTLTQIGTGVFVGDVNRRVLEHLTATAEAAVSRDGGWATIVSPSHAPQGFDIVTYGRDPLVEMDGIRLAVLRSITED